MRRGGSKPVGTDYMFLISLKQSAHTQTHSPPHAGSQRDDNHVDVIESWRDDFSRLPHYWGRNGPLGDSGASGRFSDLGQSHVGRTVCLPTTCLHTVLEGAPRAVPGSSAESRPLFLPGWHCLCSRLLPHSDMRVTAGD